MRGRPPQVSLTTAITIDASRQATSTIIMYFQLLGIGRRTLRPARIVCARAFREGSLGC
jgi:hypothetical protein